ncbi:alpha/beta-hydrolase [Annulohypoxylon maeteangense]|uniref:alpha/beta-hydrolase n=1 Tax=Annulohypoxylon maeteangense TaxID=1927788 RepID=UPI0020072470|nr:alpha/beta-hydrolase [Annulohypoxylon maeteangense]KAI0882387.1 alpha/beta-hydrolase [Annulohypoxylon maeteangense]
MAVRGSRWVIPFSVSLGVPIGLYVAFILLSAIPFFQRHFLYAHRVNTLLWHNIDMPEYWGFARNQVTPFSLTTPDGEHLYAWHILPLPTYIKHENTLHVQKPGFSKDITKTESFKLLRNDPEGRLVIYFHGNAGHVAQRIRPDSYHTLTDSSLYHVLAIDYRGFGKSTGTPSEEGLIHDGITAVDWAMDIAGIPASRIVILGHSLGTAVTSGIAEHFAMQGTEFAGVILVAGFSSLPTLVSTYAVAGFIPILSPIRAFPSLLRFLQSFIVDEWKSADRLSHLVSLTRTRLRLTFIHAKDDLDIPCHESDVLFRYASSAAIDEVLDDIDFLSWKEQRTSHGEDGTFVAIVKTRSDIIIREEIVPYGGHNHVMISSAVALAVMRSFGLDNT